MMPDSMLQLAEQKGIDVRYVNYDYPLDGLYWKEAILPPVIFIAKRIVHETPLFRCVLAEELGHHFTTVGGCLPKQFFSRQERMLVSKAEYKAAKWAAFHLIPQNNLNGAIENGILELWDLAEYFRVTELFMRFRMRLYRGETL